MIPFNLKIALSNIDQVRLRNGESIRALYYLKESACGPKLISIDRKGVRRYHTDDGRYQRHRLNCPVDLILIPNLNNIKTMKPFNLEKALAGEPVQYRDGRKVKGWYNIPELSDQKILSINDNMQTLWHDNEGKFALDPSITSDNDLVMAEPSVKKYHIFMSDGSSSANLSEYNKGFNTSEAAFKWLNHRKTSYLETVVCFTYLDGQLTSVEIVPWP